MLLFHYTDRAGFKAIVASPTWVFRASWPPAEHEFGAYFTTYDPNRPLYKLVIPDHKREFVFCFEDAGDLTPIRGGRGRYVVYFPSDYEVVPGRQIDEGPVEGFQGAKP